jgi:DNA-binding CsgD family transcriptional regulator
LARRTFNLIERAWRMERLRERDLEASLTYLRGLYAQGDPASFRRHVPETITSLVPSELTTYNELDLRTSENVWEWEPAPSDPDGLAGVFARYMAENPCIAYYLRTRDGRATKISDFLTRRELRHLGYYSEYLRRVGLQHRMSIVIPKPPHTVIALALGRSGRDFSERDRLMLDLLRPHLAQAHDNAAAMARVRREAPAHPSPMGKGTLFSKESVESLGLTGREAEVLAGAARGETNKEIAASLYVSPLTVKTHLQRVYRKLGVENRTKPWPGRSSYQTFPASQRVRTAPSRREPGVVAERPSEPSLEAKAGRFRPPPERRERDHVEVQE